MTKIIKFASLAVLILTFIGYTYLNNMPSQTKAASTDNATFDDSGVGFAYAPDSQADFYCYQSDFFFGTKDGMKFVSSKGDERWDYVYSMVEPVMVCEKGIVCVAEAKGRNIYVFNKGGLMYTKTFDEPILTFAVNGMGYLAAAVQRPDGYEVYVFNDQGTSVGWRGVFNEDNLFPVALDVSDDGRIIGISFIDINKVYASTKLIFAYLNGEEGRQFEDTIFAYKEAENYLITTVRFMKDNNFITVSADEIICMEVGQNTFSEKWKISLGNRLSKLGFLEDTGVVLALGDGMMNRLYDPVGTLRIYDLNGTVTGERFLGNEITYLSTGSNACIVGVNRSFQAINADGGLLWSTAFTKDVSKLLFIENTGTVLQAGGGRVAILRKNTERK